jgi:hypothetical protein
MASEGPGIRRRRGIGAAALAIVIMVVAIVVASSACMVLYNEYLSQGREVSGLKGTVSSLQQDIADLGQQLDVLQGKLNLTGSSQSVSIEEVICETNVCSMELVGLKENVSVTGIEIGNVTFTWVRPLCRCGAACPMYVLGLPIRLRQGVATNVSESVSLVPGQSVVVRVFAYDGSVASAKAPVGNGTCIP